MPSPSDSNKLADQVYDFYDKDGDSKYEPHMEFFPIKSKSKGSIAATNEIDWFGNCDLHHAYANDNVNIERVSAILKQFPELIDLRNQFGRTPLHYAVDRARPHFEGIRLLLEFEPSLVTIKDDKGETPYDLAKKWEHSKPIMKELLESSPNLDPEALAKLKFGMFSGIVNLFRKPDQASDYAFADDPSEECTSISSLGPQYSGSLQL